MLVCIFQQQLFRIVLRVSMLVSLKERKRVLFIRELEKEIVVIVSTHERLRLKSALRPLSFTFGFGDPMNDLETPSNVLTRPEQC